MISSHLFQNLKRNVVILTLTEQLVNMLEYVRS